MSDKRVRDLEREYRQQRAQILGDEKLSWEAKMRSVKRLHERYSAQLDTLEEEAAVDD